MINKKLLPLLLFVSLLVGAIHQPGSASLILKSRLKGFFEPNDVITVCPSGCNHTSIQVAINNAQPSGGDTIQLVSETYTETITIDKSLTLTGTGYLNTIIQAASDTPLANSRVIAVTDGITVEINGISIRHGNSSSYGGGILNQGTLTLNNCLITNNSANYGGGVANSPQTDPAKLTISNTTIEQNEAVVSGAGIYNYALDDGTLAKVTVMSSTMSANLIEQPSSYGGGVANIAGEGTAIFNASNSTFSSNKAGSGGGIYTQSSITGTVTTNLEHTTFFGNTATDEGSNLFAGMGNTTLKHSIMAYGQDSDDCQIEPGAALIDGGYNLVEDGCDGISASGNPRLAALANNGGDTKTHALLSSSPALDLIPPSQCSTSFDQRDVARPYGAGCDSGSFESNTNEIEFLSTVNDDYIKPGGLVIFTMRVDLIGPGLTNGTIRADIPPELTIQEPLVMDPPGSGEFGTPPILAQNIVISANQIFTLTMVTNVAEGLKAGTVITPTVSFTSTETPIPEEDTFILVVENVPPIAVDDQGAGFLASPDAEIYYTDSVLDNDIDLNGDPLTILIPVNTDNLQGIVSCDEDSGICAYEPNGQFDHMIPGQTETDTFTYTIIDNQGGIGGEDATATVTITLRKDAFTVYLPLLMK